VSRTFPDELIPSGLALQVQDEGVDQEADREREASEREVL